MIQGIIVALIFIAAVGFVVRQIVVAFRAKSACSSGCGKCGAVDFEKISRQISEKGI